MNKTENFRGKASVGFSLSFEKKEFKFIFENQEKFIESY
jgi:hypothetical protein